MENDQKTRGGAAVSPRTCDVAIVGLGPTGATAANLLGREGLSVIVIEKDLEVFPRQRAMASDEDAHRLWQSVGLWDEMREAMHLNGRVEFVRGSKRFLTVNGSGDRGQGVPSTAYFNQPELESILRRGISRFKTITVLNGWEVTAVDQHASGVITRIRNVETGTEDAIDARYVIAADGGSSTVRKYVGIDLLGSQVPEQWFDVQLKSWYPLAKDAPLHFRFIADPARPGVDSPSPMGHHRLEFQINPGESPESLSTPEGLRMLLAERGIDYDDVEVYKCWAYTFHIRQARTWRRGRILLAGDAAHLMPPFAGQGISSGVRDVGNLCWKLAAVIRGCNDKLLDTYQAERRPNVMTLTRYSQMIGHLVMMRSAILLPLRDIGLRTATNMPVVGPWLTAMGTKPTYRLRRGRHTFLSKKGRLAGHFLFQTWVVGNNHSPVLLDDVLGTGWVWVTVKPEQSSSRLNALGVPVVTILPPGSPRRQTPPNHYIDLDGKVYRQLRRSPTGGVLVRPDRFIYGSRCDDHEVEDVILRSRLSEPTRS